MGIVKCAVCEGIFWSHFSKRASALIHCLRPLEGSDPIGFANPPFHFCGGPFSKDPFTSTNASHLDQSIQLAFISHFRSDLQPLDLDTQQTLSQLLVLPTPEEIQSRFSHCRSIRFSYGGHIFIVYTIAVRNLSYFLTQLRSPSQQTLCLRSRLRLQRGCSMILGR